MLNGLNEIHNSHYVHYDRFGEAFASHGVGSMLLPTPFHLNRTPYLTKDDRESYE